MDKEVYFNLHERLHEIRLLMDGAPSKAKQLLTKLLEELKEAILK